MHGDLKQLLHIFIICKLPALSFIVIGVAYENQVVIHAAKIQFESTKVPLLLHFVNVIFAEQFVYTDIQSL